MVLLRGLLFEWNRKEAEWVSQTQRSATGTRVQSNPSARYCYFNSNNPEVVPRKT